MTTDAQAPARLRLLLPEALIARRGDPTRFVELPLKLLVVADFTARADPRPLEDRGTTRVTAATLEKVRREHKPAGEPPAWSQLTRLLERLPQPGPPNDTSLDRPPAEVTPIAAHEGESPAPEVLVELWNSSLEDLLFDFEDAPEMIKSGLFKRVYGTTFYDVGGRPFGAVLFTERFGLRDLPLLRKLVEVAARAHLPMVVETTPELAAAGDLRVLRAAPGGRYLGFGAADVAGSSLAESFVRTGFATGVEGIDPRWLAAARVAHCIKVIHCGSVALWHDLGALQARFEAWLAPLCADPTNGPRPFHAARVAVRAEGDRLSFDLFLDEHADPSSANKPVHMSGRLIRW